MKRKLKLAIGLLAAWFVIHVIIITVDGLNDSITKADCILILGNTVNADLTLSERLRSRVDKGLEVYQQNYSEKIIVSGGLGKEGHYEGTVIKEYLVNKGVPEQDIIVDDYGVNTNATAINFTIIAKQYNLNSVIVVSQFHHISRTKLILRKKGIKNIYSAHAEYFELRDFYSILREFVGYYRYLFI